MLVKIRIPETDDEYPAIPVGQIHVSILDSRGEPISGQNFQEHRVGWTRAMLFIQSVLEEQRNPLDLPFSANDLEVA